MFWRKKLYERDPKGLSIEMLGLLQQSLIAKLILVNQELASRYEKIAELGAALPSGPEAGAVLTGSATKIRALDATLQAYLADASN